MTTRRQQGRAALSRTLDEIRLEGLRAAYERGTKILQDDGAPPTAHAQIIRCFFAAAGLGTVDAEQPEKEAHEMSADELREARDRLLGEIGVRARGGRGEVFD